MEDNTTIANDIIEENEVALDNLEENEDQDSGLGFAIAGLVLGVGAVAALIVKNKDKIKAKRIERQIKKLEKEGYNVSKIDVEDTEEVEVEEDDNK